MAWIATKTTFMIETDEDTIFPSIPSAKVYTKHHAFATISCVGNTSQRPYAYTHMSNVHSERILLHLWHLIYRAHAHKPPTTTVLKDTSITIMYNTTPQ